MRHWSHKQLINTVLERITELFQILISLITKLRQLKAAPSWPILLLSICVAILISGIILGTTLLVLNLRDRALADAGHTLTDITRILSTHIQGEFKTLDVVERNIAKRVATTPAIHQQSQSGSIDSQELHRLLKEQILAFPHIESLDLIDSNGFVIGSSQDQPLATANIADTDYFRALQNNSMISFYLSRPIKEKQTGAWKVYFARKLAKPSDKFGWLITEKLDLAGFEKFFSTVSFGSSGSIALFRNDGVLLVRSPRIKSITGKVFTAGAKLVQDSDHGSVRIIGRMDGKDRLLVAQRVADYPLVVVSGIATEAALAEWKQQTILLVVLTWLSAIAIGIVFFLIVRRLLSAHKWSKQRLALEKFRLDATINNMSQGLLMFDASERVVVCNERYREMYALSPDFAKLGCSVHDLLSSRIRVGTFGGDPDEYMEHLRSALSKGKPTEQLTALPDGRLINVINQPMFNGGWVATHEDVTARRRAEERIVHLAHHDSLTNLLNRATFSDYLTAAIDDAAKTDKPFALLCLDLDRFKEANDVYGHQIGDALLREVAARLRQVTVGSYLFRIGGDEFALISTKGPQPATAEALGERMLATFEDDFVADGHRIRLGLSIGVAVFSYDGRDAQTLLTNADAALYQAKSETRGSMRFFEQELGTRLREQRDLQNDLESAIKCDDLFLHYQPQRKITSGELIGFEALARWQCPKRGIVPPSIFIPVAEESSLILPLGEWVLREACREAASWPVPLTISVNVSAVQFHHGNLPRLVHEILLESGLSPSRLELEITESVMIGDFSRAVSILCKLKALGVRIAMDDFGSGYSSLSYLHAFPFDKIKIDKTFVSDLLTNRHSLAIVRAVIGLGRSLDVPVLAEGVDAEAQLALLVQEGCDQVQGYLTGRPLAIDAYAESIGRPAAGVALTG
jgi:diguanylate cyclase (GGDEF)-like protein